MTTNFDLELAKPSFKGNIVIAITDNTPTTTYFSQHAVDSGLTVDYEGYVIDASVNGETLDLRNVKSSVPTLNFSLLDKDDDISVFISTDTTALMGYKVEFYYGFFTGSFGWGDYELISTTNITGFSKSANTYSFTSKAPTGLLQEPIYTTETTLTTDHTDVVVTFTVDDTTDFSSSGTFTVGDEFITYTGKTATTFTGCTRAQLSSDASSHDDGSEVYQVTLIEDESMDLALDIIKTQVGVDGDLVDTAAFETLRDGDLSGDGDFKFYMWNVENALTWLEESILIATNTRLINKDNKISIALLDQVAFAADSESITESHIMGDPSYRVDVNKVVNKIIVKYDYNWGTGKYESTSINTNAESITNYGEQRPLTLKMKGITIGNNGASFATSKAKKLLARLSSPTAEIGVKALFNRFNINAADQINVVHRYLPQPGTGEAFDYMLEVLSKSPSNFKDNPVINFKLAFTSYTNVRAGLISPSPLISAVTSQKIFTVPDGTLFKAGYFLRLWKDSDGSYYADAANEIDSINGNIITMVDSFSTTLTTSIRITFPDFGDANSIQQQKYAWISPNTNLFADGTNAYGILA